MANPEHHEFRVEADALVDILLRVLGPFAVQGAELAAVTHQRSGEDAWTVLEVAGLAAEQAELLRLRLAQIPSVRGVTVHRRLGLVAASK
jgi:hypothetical protein